MKEGKKGKKGFATAIFAAMVVAALAFLASALMTQNSGYQNNQLQARLVAERFEDARDFLNETQEDAIADAAFDAFGCTQTAGGFCTDYTARLTTYLQAASILNDSIVSLSISNIMFSCNGPPSAPAGTFNYNIVTSALANVFTAGASKTQQLDFGKSVVITRTIDPVTSKVAFSVQTPGHYFSHQCP